MSALAGDAYDEILLQRRLERLEHARLELQRIARHDAAGSMTAAPTALRSAFHAFGRDIARTRAELRRTALRISPPASGKGAALTPRGLVAGGAGAGERA